MEKTAEAVFYVTSSCFFILKIKRRIPFKNLGDSNITTFIALPRSFSYDDSENYNNYR